MVRDSKKRKERKRGSHLLFFAREKVEREKQGHEERRKEEGLSRIFFPSFLFLYLLRDIRGKGFLLFPLPSSDPHAMRKKDRQNFSLFEERKKKSKEEIKRETPFFLFSNTGQGCENLTFPARILPLL